MNAPILCLMLAAGLTLAACAGGAEAPAGEPAPAIPAAVAAEPALPLVTVYKSPTCGCCSAWVDHLRGSGFRVEAVDVQDTRAIKRQTASPTRSPPATRPSWTATSLRGMSRPTT